MYAELTGNGEKYRIKSRYVNKFVLEGRVIYDAFILSQKKAGCFYHGAAISDTAATAVGSNIVHDSSTIVTR